MAMTTNSSTKVKPNLECAPPLFMTPPRRKEIMEANGLTLLATGAITIRDQAAHGKDHDY